MTNAVRGEIWLADLDPIRGHEQAGRRPILIVSVDAFNQSPAGLLIVLPITSTLRHIPTHVPVEPPEGGLTVPSMILCDAIRSIAKERLLVHWGTIHSDTMASVEDRLRILLSL
ncbi:MAG: type II toxin-antitoxin system PemK/MazF family toxin [Armatimonadetes bacterium]|nr:type II toxin-antitoxin system PemK/MazF family toxin [Armatimonadota bacterium]